MEQMNRFPVLDAEELHEVSDGMVVVRGMTEVLREQLVVKSRQPHLRAYTQTDDRHRFGNIDKISEREARGDNYYPLVDVSEGQAELAGNLWLRPEAMRMSLKYNQTVAVRLFEGYVGRHLAAPYMETALQDYVLLHPDRCHIWLEVDNRNIAAKNLYNKLGFERSPRTAHWNRDIMTRLIDARNPRIVVIGGGTGSFTVLTGLKDYTDNLTAVVNTVDDGGSSGRLRDELGVLPPGDINQCLLALSQAPGWRRLLRKRFKKKTNEYDPNPRKLAGHSWGNLTLSLLEQIHQGDFEMAITELSELLEVKGQILPATVGHTTLKVRAEDGEVLVGEKNITNYHFGDHRPQIWLEPAVNITDSAAAAIKEADMVVIAPGSPYGSLAPVLSVGGMQDALEQTEAKVTYVSNLVNKPGQTEGFKAHDFAEEIERFVGGNVLDYLIYNTDSPTDAQMDKYTRDGEFIVDFDLDEMAGKHYKAIGLPLIDKDPVVTDPDDNVAHERTLIRHDSDVLAREIVKLLSR